jgi:hypothetical protein
MLCSQIILNALACLVFSVNYFIIALMSALFLRPVEVVGICCEMMLLRTG